MKKYSQCGCVWCAERMRKLKTVAKNAPRDTSGRFSKLKFPMVYSVTAYNSKGKEVKFQDTSTSATLKRIEQKLDEIKKAMKI